MISIPSPSKRHPKAITHLTVGRLFLSLTCQWHSSLHFIVLHISPFIPHSTTLSKVPNQDLTYGCHTRMRAV